MRFLRTKKETKKRTVLRKQLEILARCKNTGLGVSARAELRTKMNPSPCNRQSHFKKICFRSRAKISAHDEIRHVIRPLEYRI